MRSLLILVCTAALLSACTSISPPAANQQLVARQYQTRIDLAGRLSAQYEANYREQSISVNFTWSQTPEQTLIALISPTGQTVATILITAQGAQLTEAGKAPRFANDINQLSTDVLGWPLPVAGLRDWLQGYLNSDHATLITKATSDQAFNADGWQLRYVSWVTEATFERPKRLDLSRMTDQVGMVSLRIVVDDWNTP
jgi:outer membrane lipoprotein LolB